MEPDAQNFTFVNQGVLYDVDDCIRKTKICLVYKWSKILN